ncbi:hypothetical protein PRZ48_005158 [Zasmidium cellare]|uniref:Uncharacterized protein n=1 Tax=Zasmidium cellare TaxID=395010 RepID=A0ABR0ERM7_ZASCE|nr:hypothetical protein PRZ48_005158 [Zasmidium cellare]
MRWSSSTTLIGGSRASKSRRTLESVSRSDQESPNSSIENQVVDIGQAGQHLLQLVDREIFLIDRGNLPSLLGLDVERTEGLRPQLSFSRDNRFILPRNQMDDIALKLKAQATDHPVDLHAFAIEHDISVESLNNLIEARASGDWPRVIIDVDHHSYLCSHAFTDGVKRKVAELVTLPGTGARDLTSVVGHGVPSAVLVALATEATSAAGGEVRFAGDHVVYIPSCTSCAEDKERQQHNEEEQQAHQQFLHLIETELWCPLHLYAAGIIETQDPTLKSDLETAATTHFTQTIIPTLTTTLTNQNLLRSPDRQSIHAALLTTTTTPQTFASLQTTIAHLGQTLSLPPLPASLVLQTKTTHLHLTAQRLQTLHQPLDILQNLIWILLATSGPGLFKSSVKYTSRMIKLYDEVGGDGEVAGMLNLWWEKVKGGLGDGEDLRQMRELAVHAVEGWREGEG